MRAPSRLAALLLLAGAARAAEGPGKNEISDELGVSSSPPTPTSKRSTQTTNLLDGVFDLGAGLALDLSVTTSAVKPEQGVPGQEFATQGATVWTLGAGLLWEIGDHYTLEGSGRVSPAAELLADSTVRYTQAGVETSLDALLYARSSSAGASLSLSYDTAGESSVETALDLGSSVDHFSTDQRVRRVRDPRTGVELGPAGLLALCRTHPLACPRPVLGLLRDRPGALTQVAVQAGLTETLWQDTDLGLAGSAYFYDRDPTEVGYFSLATAGKSASAGGGIATAPLRWSLRPSATQRLGDWTLRLALQHGVYVSDQGKLDALTAKVQYRITRDFRMWLTATGQRDDDGQGNVNVLRSVALGALYRW